MYREAWERGLKTTYYLRTLNKSGIDNAHRERRGPDLTKLEITEAEKIVCSIEAARNGETCEACQ
jgi:ribonucleoside-diphosphate reductase alpha chain